MRRIADYCLCAALCCMAVPSVALVSGCSDKSNGGGGDGGNRIDGSSQADGSQVGDGSSGGDASTKCSGAFRVEDMQGKPVVPTKGQSGYLFDPTKLHSVKLEVDQKDWAWLLAHALDEQYVRARVVFESQRYVGAAVRFKGSWTTLESCFDETGKQTCPKLSLKVSFNEYDACGRFYGQRKLVFNAAVRDPSIMRNRLAYALMRAAGVIASRASHALVSVNGGAPSVYELVEEVDHEFLERNFKDASGNLYKSVWPTSTSAEPYLAALETNEKSGDVSRFVSLAQILSGSDPSVVNPGVAALVDLPNLARVLAANRVLTNKDGIDRFYCEGATCENGNYFWYDDPKGAFTMIPWDLDNALWDKEAIVGPDWYSNTFKCEPTSACVIDRIDPCPADQASELRLPPQCVPLIRMAAERQRTAYVDALRALQLALPKAIADQVTFRAKIRAAVVADPLGPKVADFDEYNDWLKVILENQLGAVDTALAKEGK